MLCIAVFLFSYVNATMFWHYFSLRLRNTGLVIGR